MLFNILSTKMIKLTLYACSYKQLSQQSIICLSTWIKPVNTHHFLIHTPSCHHIFITKNNHKKPPQKSLPCILTILYQYPISARKWFHIKHDRSDDYILPAYAIHLFICHSKILIEKKKWLVSLYFNKEKGETNAFLNDRETNFSISSITSKHT